MTDLRLTSEDYARIALRQVGRSDVPASWEWATRHMRLPGTDQPRQSHKAVAWRHWHRLVTARLSGMPDAADPHAHRCEELWLIAGVQVYKSTFMLEILLYAIKHFPRTMGWFMNRLQDVDQWRKGKLLPSLEGIADLEPLLPRSQRAREQTLAGRFMMVGASQLYTRCAQTADDWRAAALSLLMLDEFGQYPHNVEGQGDPIALGRGRMRTYRGQRLIIGASSPDHVGGHAWKQLCSGSHERLLCECPSCGGAEPLEDDRVLLAGGRALVEVTPDEILAEDLGRLACRHCGDLLTERDRLAMITQAAMGDLWCPGTWSQPDEAPGGRWEPHADRDRHGRVRAIDRAAGLVRSGWLPSLYSFDLTLSEYAANKAHALQGTEEDRIAHTNIEAAQPYIYTPTVIDADEIAAQADAGYQIGSLPWAPEGAELILVCDQQGNHVADMSFPWVAMLVAPGGASWRVDVGHAGNGQDQARGLHALDAVASRRWLVGNEHRLPVCVAVDSANGNVRFELAQWAAEDPHRRVLIRGDHRLEGVVPWREVIHRHRGKRQPRHPFPPGVREYGVAPHHWRSVVHDRIRRHAGAPAWHLPTNPPAYYLRSLTSEEQVTKLMRVAGRGFQEMVVWAARVTSKTDRTVNVRKDTHWWDCEALGAALANILGLDRARGSARPNAPAAPPPRSSAGWTGSFISGSGW